MFRSPPNCPTNSRSRVGGFLTLFFFKKNYIRLLDCFLFFRVCVCVRQPTDKAVVVTKNGDSECDALC